MASDKRGEDVLFSTSTGSPVSRDVFRTRVWLHTIERSGIGQRVRFHDLRGAHASWLPAGGADLKAVMDRLGHKQIQTTQHYLGKLPMPTAERSPASITPATVRDERGSATRLQHVAFVVAVDNPIAPPERPTLSFMSRDQTNDDVTVDANGCLTERVAMDGHDVVVHYDDVPLSDITSINGIRCTTALRTVIDVAPELDRTELEQMVRACLDRRLFTPEEAMQRVADPDMLTRLGAELVRQVVNSLGEAG